MKGVVSGWLSMEEGDVNNPSAEAIIRQILYGNEWFQREFGKASQEYMLPDCLGFPASLPTILAHFGVKGFSTQRLTWDSSAPGGGTQSLEKTPEGIPFNVGVWVGPDGESVLAAVNPRGYGSLIDSDLTQPLTPEAQNPAMAELQKKIDEVQQRIHEARKSGQPADAKDAQKLRMLRTELDGVRRQQQENDFRRYQSDWAARVKHNGEVTGPFTDYHYYGTGDIGGAPSEESVKRLEAIVTKGSASLPPPGTPFSRGPHPEWPLVSVGNGPVHVISAPADQMFLDISRAEAAKVAALQGRDGVDESLSRVAYVADLPEAADPAGGTVSRCG